MTRRNDSSGDPLGDQDSRLIRAARQQAEAAASMGGSGRASPRLAETPRNFALPGYAEVVEIHRGAQGVVYRAVQRSTGRVVALKIVRDGPFVGPAARQRFAREVQVLGALQHPHIVTIHDSGNLAGCLYLVMDYIDGQPLDRHLERRRADRMVTAAGGFAAYAREVGDLCARIAEAVNAAHVLGIVHRDLKPSNILITADGMPHVLDFGLAKLVHGATEAPAITLTEAGQLLGTLPWISPEQARGQSAEIDHRADLYALGVMLYHALTGRHPTRVDGTLDELVRSIVHDDPVRPRRLEPRIDADLETVVRACLQKEPARRYESAAELAADLRHWAAGRPIAARRDSTTYLLRVALRRHRIAVLVAAAFVGVLVAATVGLATMYARQVELGATARSAAAAADAARHVAEQKGRQAAAVSDFLREMLASADPERTMGSDLTVREAVDGAVVRLAEGDLATEPAVEATIRATIASAYESLGLWDDALAHVQRAIQLWEALGDEAQRSRGRALQLASQIAYGRGDVAQAEVWGRQALELARQQTPPDIALVTGALGNLAEYARSRGELDRAEALQRESLRALAAATEDHEARYHAALHGLGSILADAGRLAEADELMRQVLDHYERQPPERQTHVAKTLQVHSTILRQLGRADEAVTAAREAARLLERALGPEHPLAVQALSSLAMTLHQTNAHAEAEELARRVVASGRRALAANDVRLANYLNNLGVVLQDRGRLAEAADLLQEAADVYAASHGDGHRDTVRARYNLGNILLHERRFDEAIVALTPAVAALRELLGADHPEFGLALGNLAQAEMKTGATSAAEAHFRESLQILETAAPDHWTVGHFRASLGATLLAEERYADAERQLLEAQEFLRTRQELMPGAYLECLRRLIRLYETWNEAEPTSARVAAAEEWQARLDEVQSAAPAATE